MKIRLANFADVEILVKLDKLSNLTYWNKEEYFSSLENKNHLTYVLLDDMSNVIGLIVIGILVDEAEVLQFWIKHTLKRQGYGKILLADVLYKLRTLRQIRRIFLEVRDGNTAAINLYKSFGFNIVGKRHNYYKVDSWVYDALTMVL